jgi:hypothetical protein
LACSLVRLVVVLFGGDRSFLRPFIRHGQRYFQRCCCALICRCCCGDGTTAALESAGLKAVGGRRGRGAPAHTNAVEAYCLLLYRNYGSLLYNTRILRTVHRIIQGKSGLPTSLRPYSASFGGRQKCAPISSTILSTVHFTFTGDS